MAAFVSPSPLLRVLLRALPVAPLAVWALWFDRSRPFEELTPGRRAASRAAAFIGVMLFAVLLLGLALNWLFDPGRVL